MYIQIKKDRYLYKSDSTSIAGLAQNSLSLGLFG